jgi:hypothetical protein
MSIGMTYDDFWNNDVCMVRVIREADELRRRRENEVLWTQGAYIREALMSTVGNMFSKSAKFDYPNQPYPVTAKQVEEKKERERRHMEERMKADLFAMAQRMMKKMPTEAHPAAKGGEKHERSQH